MLIASDVAARGLDIPNIEHVVHYQLPRTADLYVHRSGRTARASAEGVSVMLCSPQEVPVYKKICHVLRKSKGLMHWQVVGKHFADKLYDTADGLPEFPVDRSLISGIKQRINLARKIDEAEHQKQKVYPTPKLLFRSYSSPKVMPHLLRHNTRRIGSRRPPLKLILSWTKICKLMQIFVPIPLLTNPVFPSLDSGTLADESKNAKKQEVDQNKIKGWKAELNALLAKPLVPKGVSGLYLTSNVDEDLPEVLVQTAG